MPNKFQTNAEQMPNKCQTIYQTNVPNNMQMQTNTKQMPNNMPHNVPNNMPHNVPNNMPNNMPNNIPNKCQTIYQTNAKCQTI